MLFTMPFDATSTPLPPPKDEVYAIFAGAIDQSSVQRFFNSFAIASAPASNVSHIHLLLQSTGGFVADGICLYNFFRALPIDLTIYNIGSVSSIAVVAYLGAKKRKTSARATFMLHRTSVSPQSATATLLKSLADSVVLDDKRTESILSEHVTLSQDRWALLNYHDQWFSAEEAVDTGLADEIADFAPPMGTQIYNI
jgi:ATP-dependent Clp protease protease subunit